MLINHDGGKLGVVSFEKALKKASELSLDLVQVSSADSNPLVCKILDYGKYTFNKKKGSSNTKTKTKTRKTTTKEIKFRPSTDVGDYNIKFKKIKSFILGGDKTKRTIRFRGREILNSDMGLDIRKRIEEDLKDISQVDQEASLEGRQLLMILSPLKKK